MLDLPASAILTMSGTLGLQSTSAGELASVFGPLLLSLRVAVTALLVLFVPATGLALLLARRRFAFRTVLETVVELPLVLPPTAIGFGLLVLLGPTGPSGVMGLDLGLLFTWKAAVIAAAVMAFPLVVRSARIAFESVDPRLEQMAGTLGMNRFQVLSRVTLPLAARGLIAAGLLGFSRALGEFGATILVAGSIPGRTQTLSLALYDDIQNGRDGQAALLLLIAVLVAFAAVFTASKLQDRRAGDRRVLEAKGR